MAACCAGRAEWSRARADRLRGFRWAILFCERHRPSAVLAEARSCKRCDRWRSLPERCRVLVALGPKADDLGVKSWSRSRTKRVPVQRVEPPAEEDIGSACSIIHYRRLSGFGKFDCSSYGTIERSLLPGRDGIRFVT